MLGERLRFNRELSHLRLPFPLVQEFDRAQDKVTITNWINAGESENSITNEIFYQRNTKLRGQALTNNKHQPEWLSIRNKEVRPAVKSPLQSWRVDPNKLAAFASQYEGDSRVPGDATLQFLTGGAVLSAGRSLRDILIGRWRQGKAPATLKDVYQLASLLTEHPGAAMLLCHNVMKAFAREGDAIRWVRDKTDPSKYTDGKKLWEAKVIHKAGQLIYNGKPSLFYLLFSKDELGTDDPGDWYHYYVAAMFTAFDASGLLIQQNQGGVRREQDRAGDISSDDYQGLVTSQMGELEAQMQQGNMLGLPGYRGWLLANCVSFLEGGFVRYAKSQADVDRESRIHIQGAFAGLHGAGVKPDSRWVWHIPKSRSISAVDLLSGFSLKEKTKQVLPAVDFLGP